MSQPLWKSRVLLTWLKDSHCRKNAVPPRIEVPTAELEPHFGAARVPRTPPPNIHSGAKAIFIIFID